MKGPAKLERPEIGFGALVKSAAIATVLAQVVGLVLMGLAGLISGAATAIEGVGAVFALPMTMVFFGLPAFLWTCGLALVAFYGLRSRGAARLVPLVVGGIGLAGMAWLFITQPPPTGAIPGYDQALALIVAWTLVVWAIYAQLRLFRRLTPHG